MEVVCKKWTAEFEANGYHIEDILSLIKEAYRERAKEGISFATLGYSLDDFLAERSESDYWFLAFDDDNKLYGTARLTIFADNSGEVCNFAVLPKSQGKHIGSQLLQSLTAFGKEQGLDYIKSYTATHADSSVNCHRKNSFRIVDIFVGLDQTYSSYVFLCQFSSLSISNIFSTSLHYSVSYIKYVLFKKTDGHNTYLGNLALRIKTKKKLL